LRAALGICKTLYSIGVVSRFAELPGLERPMPPKIGYFEHHRLMMRWLLQCAKNNGVREDHDPSFDSVRRNSSPNQPFYRDEICWLYNECGIFSLAQGHIYDARALFASATREARRIEGPLDGPILRRVRLNAALASLESGNITKAEEDLRSIYEQLEEYPRIRAIAQGYLGLVNHWMGNLENADKHYTEAIEGLSKERRLRPQGIFLRHRGTLRRRQGNNQGAISDFERAIEAAAAGGFQDLFWLARVDKANIDLTQHVQNDSLLGSQKNVIKILEDADQYADKMDIPRLACQVSSVRGKLLMLQGETSRATELVTRALRIATLSGLVIRSITFRLRLAEILDRSGLASQAERMQKQARSAARRVGFRALDETFN
jgi:tetratricopeptide (TPR) repeat protein